MIKVFLPAVACVILNSPLKSQGINLWGVCLCVSVCVGGGGGVRGSLSSIK